MKAFALLAATATVTVLLAPRPANACGGCFAPPRQVTTVTGHRMAFSVSPQQTVLWDQIQYSGAPQDFAWILPVMAGARVELSHDAFFAALDAVTNPVITGPSANCGTGGGVGCGSSSAASGNFAAEGAGGGVQVLSQGVVGPYDTVTLHSSDPNALYAWLTVNGYDIPASIHPVVDAYVQGGFDFIALRLAPGQGVQAMQPVRVVMPGAQLNLPLRMVAAGAGANVGITLYVIGEGRYEAQNFPNGVVDATKLTWSAARAESNYTTLASQIMQDSGGTWLTESASLQDFTGGTSYSGSCTQQLGGGGGGGGGAYYGSPTLSGAYYCQCVPGATACGAAGASDASAPEASTDAPSGDATGDDASPEAGITGDAGGITPAPGCTDTACSAFDDLSVALTGMAPTDVWVTRMRTTLPASALSQDLVLQASANQQPVSNQLSALVYDDPSYSPCGQAAGSGGGGCNATGDESGAMGRGLFAASLAFVGAALTRRRARRRRS